MSAHRTNLRPLAMALGSTAVYLSFAIWAWGDVHQFFADLARAGVVVVTIVLAVAISFSGVSGFSTGRREMKSNRWVLAPLILLSLAAAWLAPYLDGRNWWTMGGATVRYIGLVLFVVGGTIRAVSVFALGHRFSGLVAVQEDHQLETNGVYGIVRHPSYLGLLLATAGWCLVFNSAVGLLLTLAMIVPLIGRIRAEEKFLLEELGEEYETYRRCTRWRLLPFVY